jgi:hypothetical protein
MGVERKVQLVLNCLLVFAGTASASINLIVLSSRRRNFGLPLGYETARNRLKDLLDLMLSGDSSSRYNQAFVDVASSRSLIFKPLVPISGGFRCVGTR